MVCYICNERREDGAVRRLSKETGDILRRRASRSPNIRGHTS